MVLKLQGRFKELVIGEESDPSILDYINDKADINEEKIISYLENGIDVMACGGVVTEVINADNGLITSPNIVTDGVWAWTSDLVYYVKKYHIRLCPDFIKTMEENNWTVDSEVFIDYDNPELIFDASYYDELRKNGCVVDFVIPHIEEDDDVFLNIRWNNSTSKCKQIFNLKKVYPEELKDLNSVKMNDILKNNEVEWHFAKESRSYANEIVEKGKKYGLDIFIEEINMTLKEIMLKTFENYKYIVGEREIDPVISEEECDENSPFYVGRYEMDNEQVYWKPIKMNGETFNFEELEKKIGKKLCPSIKEYYGTYWFLEYIEHYIDIYGVLHELHMPAVEPNYEIKTLEYAIEDYIEYTGDNSNNFIPFGYDYLTAVPVMIENSTGKVYLYEDGIKKGEFKFLCNSLEELLGQKYEEQNEEEK